MPSDGQFAGRDQQALDSIDTTLATSEGVHERQVGEYGGVESPSVEDEGEDYYKWQTDEWAEVGEAAGRSAVARPLYVRILVGANWRPRWRAT